MEFLLNQQFGQTLTEYQQWMMNPEQMIEDAEVWRNMGVETETSIEGLEHPWMRTRDMLLDTGFAAITVAGPHKSGKGGKLNGWREMARSDRFFRAQVGRRHKKYREIVIPYVHAVQSAKLSRVPEEFRIEPEKEAEQLYKGARFQWHLIEQALFEPGVNTRRDFLELLKARKEIILLVAECSVPFSLPTSKNVPVEVEGMADHMSAFYNLAFDPRTRDNTFAYLIKGNTGLENDPESVQYRRNINQEQVDLAVAFEGDTRPVVLGPNGKKVEVSTLSLEEKQKLANIMRISMATPAVIARDAEYMKRYLAQLHSTGVLAEPTETALYRHIGAIIDLPVGQFGVIHNPVFEGRKAYDFSYFDNYVIQQYPELLTANIRMNA